MSALSPEQIEAVQALQKACAAIGTEFVIIGAMAYRFWIRDTHRQTYDVDAAVAVDLDDFAKLTIRLRDAGWKRDARREHRWITPEGSRMDLIPAGPELRRQKFLIWPGSELRMSLIGFDHAFAEAVQCSVSEEVTARVVSLRTLALLKIASYLENPYERKKDLADFALLLSRYEPDEDRRFAADVLKAGVEYDATPAYLIGRDLAALCSTEEAALVMRLLAELDDRDSRSFRLLSRALGNIEERAIALVAAFAKGFQS